LLFLLGSEHLALFELSSIEPGHVEGKHLLKEGFVGISYFVVVFADAALYLFG